MEAAKGIILTDGNSLTVYAQSDGENMGKIIAAGEKGAAGIGGSFFDSDAGTFIVNGGNIYAEGGFGAKGIGGGFGGSDGTLTVNAGIVKTVDGAGTAHEHTFASAYSHDETKHWLAAVCEHTELTKNLGAHDTLGTDGACSVCGYKKGTDALADAQTAAKTEIDKTVNGTSIEVQNYAQTAKGEIDACTSVAAVVEKLAEALSKIYEMKTAEAVAAATEALNEALSKAKTPAAKKIGEEALVMLANAQTPEEAKAIETEAIKLMSEKDESIQNTYSLTLSGNIGTNIYLDLDAYAAENLQVKITCNTSNTVYKPNYATETLSKSDFTVSGGRYVYTVWQAPAQIAEV